MKTSNHWIWIISLSTVAVAGQSLVTFDQIFPPAKQQGMGLHKLTDPEKAALKSHVEGLLLAIVERAKASAKTPDNPAPAKPLPALVDRGSVVYRTKIDEDNDDILKLENGAVVEITGGFLGFVGFRKDAVLFKDGASWKIWIEGKRAFRCDVLKAPGVRSSSTGKLNHINEVKGDGKILAMLDGSMYEVNDFDVFTTSIWLGNSEVLLIDGLQLLNLDEDGEIIDVTRLK